MKKQDFHRSAKSVQKVRRKPRGKPAAVRSDQTPITAESYSVGRRAFAKISEVGGIRLSEDAEAAFAEFDAQGLSADERRRAIMRQFKREVS